MATRSSQSPTPSPSPTPSTTGELSFCFHLRFYQPFREDPCTGLIPPSRYSIAAARRAISLVWQASGEDLQPGFLVDVAAAKS